jgi:hypothetical protein
MKTKELLRFFACALTVMAVSIQAQPFSVNLLGSGTVRSIHCDTTGVSQGPAGANQMWMISPSPQDSSVSSDQVSPAANTPFAAKFPLATDAVVSKGAITAYTYFRIAGDSLIFLGIADSLQAIMYSDPQLAALRSLTLGNSFTDAFGFRGTVTVSSVMLVSKISGTKTVTFDGTGTLVLPWKTFPHAMRFKSETIQTDSTWLGTIMTSTSASTMTSFNWIDTTLPENTGFSITRSTTGSTITSVTSEVITYTEPVATAIARPLGHNENIAVSLILSQFDNAVSVRLPLKANREPVMLIAYNVSGKTVAMASLHTSAAGLASGELSTKLSKGIYPYSLKTGGGLLGQGKILVR